MAIWDEGSSDYDARFDTDPYGVFTDPKTGKSYLRTEVTGLAKKSGIGSLQTPGALHKKTKYKKGKKFTGMYDLSGKSSSQMEEFHRWRDKYAGKEIFQKGDYGKQLSNDELSFNLKRTGYEPGLYGGFMNPRQDFGMSQKQADYRTTREIEAANKELGEEEDIMKRKRWWTEETTRGERGQGRKEYQKMMEQIQKMYKRNRDYLEAGWGW